MPRLAQLVPPSLRVVQAVDVGDVRHLGDHTLSQDYSYIRHQDTFPTNLAWYLWWPRLRVSFPGKMIYNYSSYACSPERKEGLERENNSEWSAQSEYVMLIVRILVKESEPCSYLEDYCAVGRAGVIEKRSHQVYASSEMFWSWRSVEENEGYFV